MTSLTPAQYYDANYHNLMIERLYERLINNPEALHDFIIKTHKVVYESFYRNLGEEGTTEYLSKAIPELEKLFGGNI